MPPETAFLAYMPDPFAVGESAFAILNPDGSVVQVNAVQLSAVAHQVVTVDATALIEELVRQNASAPAVIIDISEALKLLLGRSKRDGAERQWDPWPKLISLAVDRRPLQRYKEAFRSSANIAPNEQLPILSAALLAFKELWTQVLALLEKKNELQRFTTVEVPVAQIFYRRQILGIAVNSSKLQKASEAAKREKYQAYVRVAEQTGVSPTGMNFRNVERYIENTDAAYLSFASQFDTIEEYFRMAADFSTFARDFVAFVRANRDLQVLSRLSGTDRAYPRFHPHGTVTSRILVSDPYLQQLRRKYRSAISPDNGFGLAYMDFRQFEPGILAGLSKDDQLQKAYNSQDLYLSLATSLFGETDGKAARDLAKKMFLGFCYGMSQEHIARVVAGPDASMDAKEEMAGRVETFFARYAGLNSFKAETEASLHHYGFVETLNGNRRYRMSKGTLTNEERRWSVSQRIQGTASLIFKEALLALDSRFGTESMILPMHDAILMQFPTGQVRANSSEASSIMKQAFNKYFPELKPKVSIESFAE